MPDDAPYRFPPGTRPETVHGALADGILALAAGFRAQIAELRQRLDALDQVRYLGIWQRQADYRPGNFVTRDGAIWHCERPSRGVAPGSDPAAWTLAAKAGRGG